MNQFGDAYKKLEALGDREKCYCGPNSGVCMHCLPVAEPAKGVQPLKVNPFPVGTESWGIWMDGWEAGRSEPNPPQPAKPEALVMPERSDLEVLLQNTDYAKANIMRHWTAMGEGERRTLYRALLAWAKSGGGR